MFGEFIYDSSSACFANALLLVDRDTEWRTPYADAFERCGYEVVRWPGDIEFRIEWEDKLKWGAVKLAVIVWPGEYVPYDIRQFATEYEVSLGNLFPLLDTTTLENTKGLDLDFLAEAYVGATIGSLDAADTRTFLRETVQSRETAQRVYDGLCSELDRMSDCASSWRDWISVAETKAHADVISAEYRLGERTNAIVDGRFKTFMLNGYGTVWNENSDETPVIVGKAMDYMHESSLDKFAIVVVDGMSEFDWRVISESFEGIAFEQSAAFAMVPTITSISRQCLLSGKMPVQLEKPWSQSKEKTEFVNCCRNLGTGIEQIFYGRDYDVEVPKSAECVAVIILDVDERIHGQHSGRAGMYQDMKLLTQDGKLAELVRRLTRQGFDVFISADHGNTSAVGQGRVTRTGVETETRSKRMIALKDFADVEVLLKERDLIEFPPYYLDKGCEYFICQSGESFDNPGAHVMSHGGISIDEVIVPFITIKAEV